MSKIMGRAQKGLQRRTNIHSYTINIIDRISGAWERMEEMGVLRIEIVKAFDNVDHEFIRKTLCFFNFGNWMVDMVMAILKNRVARVAVGESYSESFEIQRGTPQGVRSSPFIFILCQEILLIKIRSKLGNGINYTEFLGDWIRENDMGNEGTSESYADDLTLLFKMDPESMVIIMEVMECFRLVSGLELNKGKTQSMVVGGENYVIGAEIAGIVVVEQVKVLGIYTGNWKIWMKTGNWQYTKWSNWQIFGKFRCCL